MKRFLNMKKVLILLLCFLFFFSIVSEVGAHSGRTDSNGGHRDNNNTSGLGGYHYHHGMGPHLHPGGVCPYSQPAPKAEEPVPKTEVPAIKNETIAEELVIENESVFEEDDTSTYSEMIKEPVIEDVSENVSSSAEENNSSKSGFFTNLIKLWKAVFS